MRWWLAIPFAFALFILSGVLAAYLGNYVVWVMILVTSAWAAVASSKIKLKEFKSAIPYKPVGVFFAVLLLWIVGFPLYLIIRHRIKSGHGVAKAKAGENQGCSHVLDHDTILRWV